MSLFSNEWFIWQSPSDTDDDHANGSVRGPPVRQPTSRIHP